MFSTRWFMQGAAIALAWICLSALPVVGQTYTMNAPGDAYHPGNYGRIRYEENGPTILRAESGNSREFLTAGRVNTPIFRGDTLATGPNERAEAQLANGSLVRLDQYSHVVFAALPDPYLETLDETILQLDQGGLRLESSLDEQKDFRIDTPGCRIFVSADTDLRVAARRGRTRIATRRGIARVESGGSSMLLHEGMATEVVGGSAPLGARPYNSFLADDFDRWVAVRQSQSAANLSLTPDAEAIHESLPAQVQPYFRELSLHGMWVRNEHFGYAWVPQVPIQAWRPYRLGHWGYGQRGYFWISHEPWGWAPYHFGRWISLDKLGWAWVPGHVFAGAWVSWSWGSSHVGWAPLDFWNTPARRSTVEETLIDPQSWTLVAYEHLGRPDLVNYYAQLSGDAAPQFLAVVQQTPAVSPTHLAEPEIRLEAIASAQEYAQSFAAASTSQESGAVRRSFLELERGSAPRAEGDGSISAAAANPSAEPGDLRHAEVQPTLVKNSTTGNLAPVNRNTVVRGRPTAMRPLVSFEQKGVVKVSERWKVIFHKVAQPRPTQTPSSSPAMSPGSGNVEMQSTAPESPPEGDTLQPADKRQGEGDDQGR